jgi:signal transduction protein with GAF and PtsI domain
MSSEDPWHDRLARELQRLIRAIETGGRAVLPRSNDALLRSIVEAAARIFGGAAASILLVNEEKRTLEFRVAYGAANRDLVGMSFPLDHGIAGYVAMTGQPIAISDVQRDARFNRDFAEATGYVPRSILATPLLSGERVIGVMEVLDKIDSASFGMQDMELLGIFAGQAALAIHQSQQMEGIGDALVMGLKQLAASDPTAGSPELMAALDQVSTDRVAKDGSLQARDILALADLFNDIGTLGDAERQACTQILEAFAGYARSRKRSW